MYTLNLNLIEYVNLANYCGLIHSKMRISSTLVKTKGLLDC
jgi:hypothetical protein